MGSDGRGVRKRSGRYLVWVLLFAVFLFLFSIPRSGFAQEVQGEVKEISNKFSDLIENGSRMIRENEFEKVFGMIRELPPERKVDFRVRVIENFANLKAYLVSKNEGHGKKWQGDYKPMCYSLIKTATPILVDLLKDDDPYIRAFTARALGYLGDQTCMESLERVATLDPNPKVRSRAREAYDRLFGKKLPP